MICWWSPGKWVLFSGPFSFPTLTRALLSCFAQFLLRQLFICACCSTAVPGEPPAPQTCAESCPRAVWEWQAQPRTWAAIPLSLNREFAQALLTGLSLPWPAGSAHEASVCPPEKHWVSVWLCHIAGSLGICSLVFSFILSDSGFADTESACASWTLARIVYSLH